MYNLIDGKTFSNNLKRLLDERNLTQNDVCKGTGISQATISRYLKPNCKPIKINVMSLAAFFYVNLKWLARGEGPKYAIYFDPLIDNDKGKIINEEWLKTGKGDKFVSIEAPDTPESTISEKPMPGFGRMIDEDPDKMPAAKLLLGMMQKIDAVYEMVKNLTAREAENKKLKDQLDKFKEIMNKYQPPDGVQERRRCRREYDNYLESA